MSAGFASWPVSFSSAPHDFGHLAHAPVYGARRPVGLAHFVEHRAANADAGVGLEVRALARGVMTGCVEQSDHAGLDEIIDLDVRRHAAHQVIGDALHQIRMPQDEFILRHVLSDLPARRSVRFPRTAFLLSLQSAWARPGPARTRRSRKNSTCPRALQAQPSYRPVRRDS